MIPPRWFYRATWWVHAALDRVSGGRLGTSRPRGGRLGVLFLVTRGHRSGQPRRNGLYFVENGADLLVIASNAGADVHPGWWANLQAQPAATVEVGGRSRAMRARAATSSEADDAWRRFIAASPLYAEYRAATNREIPVVVLEPLADAAEAAWHQPG